MIRAALMLAAMASSAANAATPIRVVTADERKSCEYLGLVSVGSAWAWHSAKGALSGAMKKVRQLGGDSLFVVSQGDDAWTGRSVSGEAYRCAKG